MVIIKVNMQDVVMVTKHEGNMNFQLTLAASVRYYSLRLGWICNSHICKYYSQQCVGLA